jgi:2-iminobutanoate/2-iminopropanoate deaminase
MKKSVMSDKAPLPIGPYVQGIIASGNFLFLSAQLSLDTKGNMVGTNVKEQTRQIIHNIEAILNEADCTLNDVIKTTVFLKNMNDFADMNEVYGEFFSENPPARSAFEVSRLPKDGLVGIESIAVIK